MQEGEEVTAAQDFHHYVDVVLIFEDVVKFYNVWMLANLEYFNFSFEQFEVFQRKFLLFDNFDCNFLTCHFVLAQLDQTVFAFAQVGL